MNTQNLFVAIARHVFDTLGCDEDNVLASMIMLHTQDFLVSDNCELDDVLWPIGEPRRLEGITRRHAAEIVVESMGHKGRQDIVDWWYFTYSARTPYELLESVPQPMLKKVKNVIACASEHPLVASVIDSD